jgi:hypothetical protein
MNMFKSTDAKTVDEYLANLPEPRRSDMLTLHELIQTTVPHPKPLIRSGMIGYGTYHYRYDSGREGDWSLILLASQKNYISLYLCATDNGNYIAESHKNQLPKATIGKSCIRFRSIGDVDLAVITNLITRAVKLGGMGEIKV